MTELAPGPGWWQAADGKWYSPTGQPAPSTNPAVAGDSSTPSTPTQVVVQSSTISAATATAIPAQSVTAAPTKNAARTRRQIRRNRFILLVVVVVIAAIAVSSLGGGGASAKFKAHIEGINAIDPGEVNVGIYVTNVGTASGTPTCTINISSPGGAYTGVDAVTADQAIPKGQSAAFQDTITVTNNGAQYATVGASSVSC